MSIGKIPEQDARTYRRRCAQSHAGKSRPRERRRLRARARRPLVARRRLGMRIVSFVVRRMAVAHLEPRLPPWRRADLPIVGRGARSSGRRARASFALARDQAAGGAPARAATSGEDRRRASAAWERCTPPSSHRRLVRSKTSLANALLPGSRAAGALGRDPTGASVEDRTRCLPPGPSLRRAGPGACSFGFRATGPSARRPGPQWSSFARPPRETSRGGLRRHRSSRWPRDPRLGPRSSCGARGGTA